MIKKSALPWLIIGVVALVVIARWIPSPGGYQGLYSKA